MIRIIYDLDNERFDFLESSGHANYSESGSDIICSAVSAILIGGLNAIKNIDDYKITQKEKGYLKIELSSNNQNHDDYIVLKTMLIQLMSIEQSYSKFVTISKKKWKDERYYGIKI